MGLTFVRAVCMKTREMYKVEWTGFKKYVRRMREEKAVKDKPRVSSLEAGWKRKLITYRMKNTYWVWWGEGKKNYEFIFGYIWT